MSDELNRFAELVAWLQEEGYNEKQIDKILERVKEYDDGTKLVSEMDSIENGDFQIAAIIEEALAGADDSED